MSNIIKTGKKIDQEKIKETALKETYPHSFRVHENEFRFIPLNYSHADLVYKHLKDLKSFFEEEIELINMVIDNTPPANDLEISVLKENLSEIEIYFNETKIELASVRKWYLQEKKSVPESIPRKEEEQQQRLLADDVMTIIRKRVKEDFKKNTKLFIDDENRKLILNGKEYMNCTPIVLFIINILFQFDEPIHQDKIRSLILENSLFKDRKIPYGKRLYDFFRHTDIGKKVWDDLIKKEGKGKFSFNSPIKL